MRTGEVHGVLSGGETFPQEGFHEIAICIDVELTLASVGSGVMTGTVAAPDGYSLRDKTSPLFR